MTTIGDVCTRICSGGTPSSRNSSYYDNGTIPWLNTKEVNWTRITSTEKQITDVGLNNSSAKWIDENAVIVAMYGATAGKAAVNTIPLTTNQACCNLSVDPTKADYRYLYYWFMDNYNKVSGMANGGAQQNLSATTIKNLEIDLPDLEAQCKIANILWSIDESISNNSQLNDYLAA